MPVFFQFVSLKRLVVSTLSTPQLFEEVVAWFSSHATTFYSQMNWKKTGTYGPPYNRQCTLFCVSVIKILEWLWCIIAVEWSRFENFAPLVGCHIITDPHCSQYEITQLEPACNYYVRVSAGNVKGFGPPSSTLIGVPSSKI